jgi:hypothetical protein
MFDFLKPKPAPEGPVTFDFDIEIERAASEVYALLDWADPRNAKRQLGSDVVPVEDMPGRFRLYLEAMPAHVFEIAVTEAVPDQTYAFECEIEPSVGRLVSSREVYTFEALGPDRCLLRLVNTATLVDGMKMKDFEFELMQLSVACHNALAKLKIHAEQGAEAVRAVEGKLIV